MPERELVVVTLRGIAPIWETIITTIRNNDVFHRLMSSLENSRRIKDDLKRQDTKA